MSNRPRILNYRSAAGQLIKNSNGLMLTLPPFMTAVETGFNRVFNMSLNDFGKENPISHTDKGQNAKATLTIGNGRSQADILELLFLLEFENVTADVPYVQEVVVGASGQTFNAVDNAWEVSAAASGIEGNGMPADILQATDLSDTTCQVVEIPRETYVASGAVTAGTFQQGPDRALRLSNSLVGRTLKIYGDYSTTTLRLSDNDPGSYTLIAKAVRSEDNQIGLFTSASWVPDGTATWDPAGDNMEIPGTFEFTGQDGCSSPYQFYIPKTAVACLNQ